MSMLAVFIDAGYIKSLAKNEFNLWVDYELISGKILSVINSSNSTPIDLLRTYYYDCLPFQSNPPKPEEALRFGKARKMFDHLSKIPQFVVREGRLKYRGKDINGEPILQQKRVDLMLGLDIALLSAKHQISHLAILSGDSDLVPAVEVAKNEGISVWLFHGPAHTKGNTSSYATDLWQTCDMRFEMNMDFMNAIKQNHV